MSISKAIVAAATRPQMRRSIWCEGCGLGNMQDSVVRAVLGTVSKRLGVDASTALGLEAVKNNVAFISGIGCTSRMPGHLDFNTVHTTHGRALTFAQGLKMARPELTVVLAAGDGDSLAIGGNHFIHAARRNSDLTLIVYDNNSYGMTGAQHSPTSPLGEFGTSAPHGVFEPPFDLIKLAVGAGTSFVAQGALTTSKTHLDQVEALIAAAIEHRGFSFVNLIGTCHTGWGAKNNQADAFKYRKKIEHQVFPFDEWQKLSAEDQLRFIPIGIIHQDNRPDLQTSKEYLAAIKRAQAAGKSMENLLEEINIKVQDPLAHYDRTVIRFAGAGGHGVVKAGEIALKSIIQAGQNGIFTKNYGPEARGGEAFTDLIFSEGEIHFPQSDILDVLVALNQLTFDKFRSSVKDSGIIFVDSSSVTETYKDTRVLSSPMGRILAEEVRPPKPGLGLNVIALAVTFGYLDLVPRSAIEEALMKTLGGKNPRLNQKALEVGFKEADRLKGRQ